MPNIYRVFGQTNSGGDKQKAKSENIQRSKIGRHVNTANRQEYRSVGEGRVQDCVHFTGPTAQSPVLS